MKKLITICLFMATTFAVNAQDKKPNFEETVKYIDNLVGSHKSSLKHHYVFKFTAKKNGEITFNYVNKNPISMNLFNMTENIYINETPGISSSRYLRFTFVGNDKYYLNLEDDKLEDCRKLKKAFEHLQSLCTKEKDPFGE
jgi:hypothetical protein